MCNNHFPFLHAPMSPNIMKACFFLHRIDLP